MPASGGSTAESDLDAELWLRTDRLGLRRFTPADRAWLEELYRDPEVMRHLGGPQDRAAVERMLAERILDYYQQHPGLGMWMTVDRATGAPLGFHLLNHIQGEPFIQVGFVLARKAWGRGIGTEMALALLDYGYRNLRLPGIVGITNLDNLASQRVLLKIGLHRNGERSFSHPAYAAAGPLAWFERDAVSWLAERGGRVGRVQGGASNR